MFTFPNIHTNIATAAAVSSIYVQAGVLAVVPTVARQSLHSYYNYTQAIILLCAKNVVNFYYFLILSLILMLDFNILSVYTSTSMKHNN